MPRRKRNWLSSACYHITHRCIDKQYFLKTPEMRDIYIEELHTTLSRFNINLLNYILTCNHVHFLIYAKNGNEISNAMQYLQGRIAQRYNIIAKREGPFWSGRYHATLIEDGHHLTQALFYMDYNMMRAGVVDHPSKWEHSGYHELSGSIPFSLISKNVLFNRIGVNKNESMFFEWYNLTINNKSDRYSHRESCWSEALAIGSKSWVEKLKGKIGKRRLIVISDKITDKKMVKYTTDELQDNFSLNEEVARYSVY